MSSPLLTHVFLRWESVDGRTVMHEGHVAVKERCAPPDFIAWQGRVFQLDETLGSTARYCSVEVVPLLDEEQERAAMDLEERHARELEEFRSALLSGAKRE